MIDKGVSGNRIAIFDLDGTLIDSDRWLSRELIETFKGLGVSITEEEANIEGKRDKYKLAYKHGFSKKELDRSYRQNVKCLYTLNNALRSGELALYPEILRTLASLRKNGVALGLLPRATRERDVALKVQRLRLGEYFEDRIVVVPNNGHNTKYKGAVDLLIKMQGQNGKVYCIGDRAEDVVVADDLKGNNQIDAEGIYVHRLNSPDADLTRYKRVKSLEEIPDLVLKK